MNGTTAPMSPVTESEMREMFDRFISNMSQMRDRIVSVVVERSNTHRELEELKQRFTELNERVGKLVEEAQKLRTDLWQATAERDRWKREAEENKLLAESYAKDNGELRNQVNSLRTEKDKANLDLSEANAKLVKFKEFFSGFFPVEPPKVDYPSPVAEGGWPPVTASPSEDRVVPRYEELPGNAPKFDPIGEKIGDMVSEIKAEDRSEKAGDEWWKRTDNKTGF